jgi:hypothetical protein
MYRRKNEIIEALTDIFRGYEKSLETDISADKERVMWRKKFLSTINFTGIEEKMGYIYNVFLNLPPASLEAKEPEQIISALIENFKKGKDENPPS